MLPVVPHVMPRGTPGERGEHLIFGPFWPLKKLQRSSENLAGQALEPSTGLEPVTPSLQVRCSTELSYEGALSLRSLTDSVSLCTARR